MAAWRRWTVGCGVWLACSMLAARASAQPAAPPAPPEAAATPPVPAAPEHDASQGPEPAPEPVAIDARPAVEAPEAAPAAASAEIADEAPAAVAAGQPAQSGSASERPAAPATPWRFSPHAYFGAPRDQRRHLGLSVRMTVGVGYAWASREIARGSSDISGADAVLNLDVGAAVVEDLILFARVGGFAFDHASSSDTDNAGTAFFGTFGAGARYHFMPLDLYASGALALAAVSVMDDLGNPQNAGPGFGFEVEAGKNWWAGSYRERWTVGLGLRLSYVRSGSVEPRRRERTDDAWVGTALSLVFSTSYN